MDLDVIIPLIFSVIFLIIDVLMFIRMIYLLKNSKNDTAETLGNKLNPYLYASGTVSILLAISMILMNIFKYI